LSGALAWLTARPIAHRGLHDAKAGRIENSIGAARAAVAKGFAIECDVRATKDGEIVVFHDETLDRLTDRAGRVDALDAAAVTTIALRGSSETIPTLADFLAAVGGAVPLVVEVKSDFDGDLAATRQIAARLSEYAGPVVVESFDPALIAFLRAEGAALGVGHIPLGIVGEAEYHEADWPATSAAQREEMTHFLHYPRTRPDFLSWYAADWPHAVPQLFRQALRLPVTTWTIKSSAAARAARQWADQIVFERFLPRK
jgi:glycerophosphoryl diester phosphodiesterase